MTFDAEPASVGRHEADHPMNDDGKSSDSAFSLGSEANLFSQREFVEICARTLGRRFGVLAIPVVGSGPPRTIYALEAAEPLGLRSFSLAPCGLYARPGWVGRLDAGTLGGIVERMKGFRVRKLGWKVLFDHHELASELGLLGLKTRRESTHALALERDYDRIFARFSATIRNQIRKGRARGVSVREATDSETVKAYYRLHTELAEQKGGYDYLYPLELFLGLLPMRAARLLVAECAGRVVAGGLFFRDGASVVYWHGAADRQYSSLFPSRLVFEEAIREGCESGATLFNLGGSAGIESLEKYKELWGAQRRLNWIFEWKHPFWEKLTRITRRIRAPESGPEQPPLAAECRY
jgi:hypothetical protein